MTDQSAWGGLSTGARCLILVITAMVAGLAGWMTMDSAATSSPLQRPRFATVAGRRGDAPLTAWDSSGFTVGHGAASHGDAGAVGPVMWAHDGTPLRWQLASPHEDVTIPAAGGGEGAGREVPLLFCNLDTGERQPSGWAVEHGWWQAPPPTAARRTSAARPGSDRGASGVAHHVYNPNVIATRGGDGGEVEGGHAGTVATPSTPARIRHHRRMAAAEEQPRSRHMPASSSVDGLLNRLQRLVRRQFTMASGRPAWQVSHPAIRRQLAHARHHAAMPAGAGASDRAGTNSSSSWPWSGGPCSGSYPSMGDKWRLFATQSAATTPGLSPPPAIPLCQSTWTAWGDEKGAPAFPPGAPTGVDTWPLTSLWPLPAVVQAGRSPKSLPSMAQQGGDGDAAWDHVITSFITGLHGKARAPGSALVDRLVAAMQQASGGVTVVDDDDEQGPGGGSDSDVDWDLPAHAWFDLMPQEAVHVPPPPPNASSSSSHGNDGGHVVLPYLSPLFTVFVSRHTVESLPTAEMGLLYRAAERACDAVFNSHRSTALQSAVGVVGAAADHGADVVGAYGTALKRGGWLDDAPPPRRQAANYDTGSDAPGGNHDGADVGGALLSRLLHLAGLEAGVDVDSPPSRAPPAGRGMRAEAAPTRHGEGGKYYRARGGDGVEGILPDTSAPSPSPHPRRQWLQQHDTGRVATRYPAVLLPSITIHVTAADPLAHRTASPWLATVRDAPSATAAHAGLIAALTAVVGADGMQFANWSALPLLSAAGQYVGQPLPHAHVNERYVVSINVTGSDGAGTLRTLADGSWQLASASLHAGSVWGALHGLQTLTQSLESWALLSAAPPPAAVCDAIMTSCAGFRRNVVVPHCLPALQRLLPLHRPPSQPSSLVHTLLDLLSPLPPVLSHSGIASSAASATGTDSVPPLLVLMRALAPTPLPPAPSHSPTPPPVLRHTADLHPLDPMTPLPVTLPVWVADAPWKPVRGLSLDTARHFVPVVDMLATLDAMAAVKLNVLHWHAVDAQSWPLDLVTLPSLARVGSWHYPVKTYTHADLVGVVKHAADRGIRVVMEVDAPAHALGMGMGAGACDTLVRCDATAGVDLHTYDQYALNPTTNASYGLYAAVLAELSLLLPDGYLHLGGDEVVQSCWESSPSLKAWAKTHLTRLTAALAGVPEYGHARWYVALLAHWMRRAHDVLGVLGKTGSAWEDSHSITTSVDKQRGVDPHAPPASAETRSGGHDDALGQVVPATTGDDTDFGPTNVASVTRHAFPLSTVIQGWKCWVAHADVAVMDGAQDVGPDPPPSSTTSQHAAPWRLPLSHLVTPRAAAALDAHWPAWRDASLDWCGGGLQHLPGVSPTLRHFRNHRPVLQSACVYLDYSVPWGDFYRHWPLPETGGTMATLFRMASDGHTHAAAAGHRRAHDAGAGAAGTRGTTHRRMQDAMPPAGAPSPDMSPLPSPFPSATTDAPAPPSPSTSGQPSTPSPTRTSTGTPRPTPSSTPTPSISPGPLAISRRQVRAWAMGMPAAMRSRLPYVGGEAAVWLERMDESNIHCRTWPRAGAVAEVLWSQSVAYDRYARARWRAEYPNLLTTPPTPTPPPYHPHRLAAADDLGQGVAAGGNGGSDGTATLLQRSGGDDVDGAGFMAAGADVGVDGMGDPVSTGFDDGVIPARWRHLTGGTPTMGPPGATADATGIGTEGSAPALVEVDAFPLLHHNAGARHQRTMTHTHGGGRTHPSPRHLATSTAWVAGVADVATLDGQMRFAAPRLLALTVRLWSTVGVPVSPLFIYDASTPAPVWGDPTGLVNTNPAPLLPSTVDSAQDRVPGNGWCPGINQVVQRPSTWSPFRPAPTLSDLAAAHATAAAAMDAACDLPPVVVRRKEAAAAAAAAGGRGGLGAYARAPSVATLPPTASTFQPPADPLRFIAWNIDEGGSGGYPTRYADLLAFLRNATIQPDVISLVEAVQWTQAPSASRMLVPEAALAVDGPEDEGEEGPETVAMDGNDGPPTPVLPPPHPPPQPPEPPSLDTWRHQTLEFRRRCADLGYPYAHLLHEPSHYHIALLSTRPITVVLEDTERLQRGLLVADVAGMRFMVVHLHAQEPGLRAMEATWVGTVAGYYSRLGMPVVVAGDFNTASPQDATCHAMDDVVAQLVSSAPKYLRHKFLRDWDEDDDAAVEALVNIGRSPVDIIPSRGVTLDYCPMKALLAGGELPKARCAGSSPDVGAPIVLPDAVWATRNRAAASLSPGNGSVRDGGTPMPSDRCTGTIPTAFKTDPGLSAFVIPPLRIDFVLTDGTTASGAGDGAGVACWTLDDAATRRLSDHYPVGCILTPPHDVA